jgi:diacylglycerol kinase (ATP)
MAHSADHTVVILNPMSGSVNGDGPAPEVELIERWIEGREGIGLRRTGRAGDAEEWAREAARAGAACVVAAGGDGTVSAVAHGILQVHGTRAPAESALGILPLGTGNDLAGGLGIPDDVEAALAVLLASHTRTVDVLELRASGRESEFVVNALTGGFSGQIHANMDAELKSGWGALAYLRSGVETWGERRIHAMRIEVDGEDRGRHEVLNLIVANGPRAGGGIPIAPGADPSDGLLDVVLLLDGTALELSSLAVRMLSGEADDHPLFVRFRGRHVRVQCEAPLPASVDGEPIELTAFEVDLHPGLLRVVAPPAEPTP